MKLSERLQYYRDEVRRSKKWRSDEGYDDDWKRFIDLYRGKQYDSDATTDRLMVNLIFSTINTLAPAVAVNNPKFVVNARKPEQAPQATITEEVLNYLWRQWHYQDEFRLAENDNLIVGHGWCKVGYKFTKPPEEKTVPAVEPDMSSAGGDVGIDDREDLEGNVESEMYVSDDRPFVERISPFDMFVDPDARHPKEMCWIAQRIWRPVQDVQVDDRYSPSARRKVSARGWSRWSTTGDGDGRSGNYANRGVKSFCEIIEFYDVKRKTICTFALDGEDTDNDSGFLIKPRPMPYATGHPFEMLRNYEVADHFYPCGDVEQLEPLQLELNETRTQMMNHRKRFQRKWLYERDAFDREAVAALEADVDNTMIPVMSDGNPANVIAPLPAVITPTEFYDQSAMISNDIDRVSGVTDYQRGATASTMKRTATEAAMIQDSANARAQDRLRSVESSLARLGERVIGLMQQYLTGDQVARIVTMPGKAWVPYDADYIQGQFDFEVAAGSTEPMNETFRRQSAMQLVDASMPFLQMGVANPVGLYMYILQKGFGVKDTTSFLLSQGPPPEADPATGQPQEVQPGGQAPPDQQGAPPEQMLQQGAPGGGPPMPPGGPGGGPPGAPPGADQIPPELLMAMMNGQGPMPPGA